MLFKNANWLQKTQGPAFVLFAASAAFMTYFCMYAFRKPFAASSYLAFEQENWLVSFKVALVLSQVFGYMLAKFIGVKVISEMHSNQRAKAIILMILGAELSLVLFALLPIGLNIICLFFNGLSLGMIWGVVFSYLEGRRTTEILGAILSITFILSSGVVKTVGRYITNNLGVSELWMPALTGLIFLPLLLLSVVCLNAIPKPDTNDIAARQKRTPMDGKARFNFFKQYWFGITALVLSFLLFTGFRDFLDNFQAELWMALGYGEEPTIFAYAGIRISFIVLIALAMMVLIKNNKTAFLVNHGFILFGTLLLGASTYSFELGLLDAKAWMVLLGAGLYIAYIPYNCFLFDRMIAAVGGVANVGFLLYLADSAGYIGSVSILLYRTFAEPELSWLSYFIATSYWICAIASVLVISSLCYFSIILSNKYTSKRALNAKSLAPTH
ncbi:hypothetical protein AN214_00993 [Pseudoalteromonas sp. P1-9]|uniref:DUF5690 family protein n=1 Tax=Pseudoalteromonas sp. P1-9 TaxID=1710354 RepID=UPI0006D5ECA8|nr:DUF5690 family protein [Pseudoalteromonas sp. P1-9]KPV96976.1 hypothetical protein AN214_00993 [Pseudoalteromonas sp. P1-9]